MRHSEAARPQAEEVSSTEKPKFDIEKEAAAKAEAEAAAPASQFAQDVEAYRAIGNKLAKKEQEKMHVNEASEALGTGTRAAEQLGRAIDSEIADLNQKRDGMLAGYPDGGKSFLEGARAVDKLSGELAKKEAKLKELEGMKSYMDYPGGERGAKAEIAYLKEGVEKTKQDIQAVYEKNSGLERSPAEEPILLTPEMRKKPVVESDLEQQITGEPILLTPDMIKPIEVTDDMIVAEADEEEGKPVAREPATAEGLVSEAFRDMKPLSEQEMDQAVKDKKFTAERQTQLEQAVSFLENKAFDLTDGVDRETRVMKPDGSVEVRSVHEPGSKELAQSIKEKFGVDIQAQNDANAVSRLSRLRFGLKKLFNPGLSRLVSEHNDKENLAANLQSEATATKAMIKDPGAYQARLQESSLKMFALRQKMKRPAPTISVKSR